MPKSSAGDLSAIERLVREAFARIDAAVQAPDISGRSVADLFLEWLAFFGRWTASPHPERRRPASTEDIESAERRLGFALPSELRELFQVSDGVDWVVPRGEFLLPLQGQFPSTQKLCLAGQLDTPLSALMMRQFESAAKPGAKPRPIPVHRPGVLTHVIEEPLSTLTFDEVDQFLALQVPPSSSCLLIVQKPELGFPVGTIVEIENLHATPYTNLRHWLYSTVQVHLPPNLGTPPAV